MTEFLHPGVFLTEVAFRAHPIEGVQTSQPDWTGANAHDPGVTIAQLPAWTGESLTYRMPHPLHLHAAVGSGVIGGLHVHSQDDGGEPRLRISAGIAMGPDGTTK